MIVIDICCTPPATPPVEELSKHVLVSRPAADQSRPASRSPEPKPGAGTREPESVCEEHCPSDQWPRRTQTQTLLSSINIQTGKHLKQYGLLLNIDFHSSSWKLVLKPSLYDERCFKLTDPLSVHLFKIVNRYWKLQMIGYNLAAWLSRLQDDINNGLSCKDWYHFHFSFDCENCTTKLSNLYLISIVSMSILVACLSFSFVMYINFFIYLHWIWHLQNCMQNVM